MYASVPASFWEYWTFNHKVTFDGARKLITITPNIFEIDFQYDIYSPWKEWLAISDNTKYEQAMYAIGGESATETEVISPTFFLVNGWKIKPWSGNYAINFTGNLYTDDLSDPMVPADYGNVTTKLTVSAIVRTLIQTETQVVEIPVTVIETVEVPVTQIVEVPVIQTVEVPAQGLTPSQESTLNLAYEEARRARAMATNKVAIGRTGTGDNAIDNIVVYDDDGTTVLYTIVVTGDMADNRRVTYIKPY